MFLNFTTPKFAAQAIRKASELNWKPMQFVASPGSSIQAVLKVVGFDKAEGVMTALFFKEPGDPGWEKDQAMQDYFAFMKKFAPNESPLDAISFGPRRTLLKGKFNDVTSTKDEFGDELVAFASSSNWAISVRLKRTA